MDRELPQPGEKWKYFGGNEYWIIAIATDAKTGEPLVIYAPDKDAEFPLLAWHTETDKVFSVGECKGEMIAIPVIGCFESLDAWASSLDNFLGVVSHPYGEGSSNCYRFERCEPQQSPHRIEPLPPIEESRLEKLKRYAALKKKTMTQLIEDWIDRLPTPTDTDGA